MKGGRSRENVTKQMNGYFIRACAGDGRALLEIVVWMMQVLEYNT